MPDPTVVAVMLTANRPEMARQAVQSFRAQTYPAKRLLIWDSSRPPSDADYGRMSWNDDEYYIRDWNPVTVGALRNKANDYALSNEGFAAPDIVCHWDDDDYSHPNRIAEQVALLQASGAQACGYNSMLFWREGEPPRYGAISAYEPARLGEAWLYTGSILGTSLMYWRTAWERKHFEAMSNGEDTRWLMGMKAHAVSAVADCRITVERIDITTGGLSGPPSTFREYASGPPEIHGEPRMIARIHSGPSGNTSNAYNPQVMRAVEKQGGEWRRVPEWDEHCRKVFA